MPFSTAPAVRYAVFICMGILLQTYADLPLEAVMTALCLPVIMTLLLPGKYRFGTVLLVLCILLSGMLRTAMSDRVFVEKRDLEIREGSLEITVLEQKTTPYHIASYKVRTKTGGTRYCGTLYARTNMPVLLPGRSYRVSPISMVPISESVNPYRFDYLEYAKGKGLTHSFQTNKHSVFEDAGVGDPLRHAAYRIRNTLSVRFLCVLGIEKGSLVNGFLFGMKPEIPAGISDMFRNLGISHLLAVSGLHVGLIILIVYQILLTLSLPRIARTVIAGLFLVFYCYLTGGSPSVIRSSMMSALLLSAPLFRRSYHALNAVAATAVILLLINPYYLKDVGFQFSFCAVAGILLGYSRLRELLPLKSKHAFITYCYEMLIVSLSAALFTAPVALHYFNTLQLCSLFLNLVAIPLTFCVMICAMISLPCLFLPGIISDVILQALDLSLGAFREVLRLASRSQIWTMQVSSYGKPLLTGAVFIVLFAVCVTKLKLKYRLMILTACLGACGFLMTSRPEIVQLALKNGHCILCRSGREALVINTGSTGFNYNDYDSSIKPVLEHWGIQEVQTVITAWEKNKTGTLSHLRRDYPASPVHLFPGHIPEEGVYHIADRDTGWVMGRIAVDMSGDRGEIRLSAAGTAEVICIGGKEEEAAFQ
ncbi:MAG: ComEC/Rec2 family competence protein, partial [Candidatus Marinimicrobia bacterium]|nr:ComEC/Rec2 family competence protein [Candidatus Neomarinimicrobiota bacterium]